MTPLMIQMLAIDPIVKNYNLSTLQSIVVSGAPLDKNIAELCQQKLELKHFRQGCLNLFEDNEYCYLAYGMTELCGICTLSPHRNKNIASVGVPLPGMLFKVNFCSKVVDLYEFRSFIGKLINYVNQTKLASCMPLARKSCQFFIVILEQLLKFSMDEKWSRQEMPDITIRMDTSMSLDG